MPKLRKGFWFYLPVALLAWFAPATSQLNAEPIEGLNTTYYQIEQVPPIQSATQYPVCGSEVENNINRSYDGEPYEDCTYDLFMVRMEGFITIPEHNTIEFWLASDDGGEINIGGNMFGVWQDQGCSATMSGPLQLDAGQQSLDVWMYENGGGTCLMLAWKIDDNYWEIVPDSAFTTGMLGTTTTSSSVPQTTLPESTTTTTLPPEQSTSTTEPQTTTTSSTSTTVPETSTTLVESTTSTTTTTSSTTTSVPQIVVEVPTGTTTTVVEEPYIEEEVPEETTTSTETEPETTEPETTTTEASPDTTVEETTTTTIVEEIIPDEIITEEEVAAVVEELTTITEITPEILSKVVDALNSDNITEEQVQAIVDAVVENLDTLEEITSEVLEEVLNVLESDSITQEQVQDIVDNILATEISSDQATQLATSAAVLENVNADQATEIFATVDTGELTSEQAQAIVDAVQDAPTEVKEAFEEEINVFEGGFDNYVPTDSVISVGVRRVVVAATTVSFILPAPIVSSRRR